MSLNPDPQAKLQQLFIAFLSDPQVQEELSAEFRLVFGDQFDEKDVQLTENAPIEDAASLFDDLLDMNVLEGFKN